MPELTEAQLYDLGRGHTCEVGRVEYLAAFKSILKRLDRMDEKIQKLQRKAKKLERAHK